MPEVAGGKGGNIPGEGSAPNEPPFGTHEWLQTHDLSKFPIRKLLGTQVIRNAQGLILESDWDSIKNAVSSQPLSSGEITGQTYKGEVAIGGAFAEKIGATAKALGWDMDSPQVVYMSTSAVLSLVEVRLNTLSGNIERILGKTIRYSSPEETTRQLESKTEERNQLQASSKRIKSSLQEYAEKTMPEESKDPKYLEVLQAFTHFSRGSAYTAFRNGDYANALRILEIAGAQKRIQELLKRT